MAMIAMTTKSSISVKPCRSFETISIMRLAALPELAKPQNLLVSRQLDELNHREPDGNHCRQHDQHQTSHRSREEWNPGTSDVCLPNPNIQEVGSRHDRQN